MLWFRYYVCCLFCLHLIGGVCFVSIYYLIVVILYLMMFAVLWLVVLQVALSVDWFC